jgi:hypothetical protein
VARVGAGPTADGINTDGAGGGSGGGSDNDDDNGIFNVVGMLVVVVGDGVVVVVVFADVIAVAAVLEGGRDGPILLPPLGACTISVVSLSRLALLSFAFFSTILLDS